MKRRKYLQLSRRWDHFQTAFGKPECQSTTLEVHVLHSEIHSDFPNAAKDCQNACHQWCLTNFGARYKSFWNGCVLLSFLYLSKAVYMDYISVVSVCQSLAFMTESVKHMWGYSPGLLATHRSLFLSWRMFCACNKYVLMFQAYRSRPSSFDYKDPFVESNNQNNC